METAPPAHRASPCGPAAGPPDSTSPCFQNQGASGKPSTEKLTLINHCRPGSFLIRQFGSTVNAPESKAHALTDILDGKVKVKDSQSFARVHVRNNKAIGFWGEANRDTRTDAEWPICDRLAVLREQTELH